MDEWIHGNGLESSKQAIFAGFRSDDETCKPHSATGYAVGMFSFSPTEILSSLR
jgi:hypothetical protein